MCNEWDRDTQSTSVGDQFGCTDRSCDADFSSR
jgi:hypothetical protein